MSAEWDRVLWKPQPFPDNYIHKASFHKSLITNPNLQPYAYWHLVLLCCAITQHLTSIFTFLAIFSHLRQHSLEPQMLIWASVCCFLLGYIVWEVLQTSNGKNRVSFRVKTLKSSILIFLALVSLSPVLRTLSAATSSDSIWAFSAMLFIVNALLADYTTLGVQYDANERLTSVLSMNAAISASVVLASRLTSDVEVFSLVLFSVQVFALFPMLRRRLQGTSVTVQVLTTSILALFMLCLVTPLSFTMATLCFTILFFVTFIAPAILLWAQGYKNEIHGPWDVAVPKFN